MENKYKCDVCNKFYKSYQTLWKHNKQFHVFNGQPKVNITSIKSKHKVNIDDINGQPKVNTENIINDTEIIIDDSEVINNKISKCKYCNLEFKFKQSKSRHQKTCKSRNEVENKELRKQNKELKMMLAQIIRNKGKVQQKTLDRMKNKLIEYNQNNNSGSINNGTINNTNNYNINIIALGQENIGELLTQQEKLHILNQKYQALVHFIKTVHFNDRFPQFKNIAITNNRTNEMHVFDPTTNTFKMLDKEEQTANLIEYRICDLEDFYGELGDRLDDKTRKILDDVFDKRGENKETQDKVKLLVYNNSDCVTIK